MKQQSVKQQLFIQCLGILLILLGFSHSSVAQFAGGSGTVSDPYQVSTVQQLQKVKDYQNSHFILVNDIDASATQNWNNNYEVSTEIGIYDGVFGFTQRNDVQNDNAELVYGFLKRTIDPSTYKIENGQITILDQTYWDDNLKSYTIYAEYTTSYPVGFIPIGVEHDWSSSFDGNGYSITNLTIEMPFRDNVGLFGEISETALKNIRLVNADISGREDVGGVAGSAMGVTIFNSSVTGSIEGASTVGGLVGHLFSDAYHAVIAGISFSKAVVTGDDIAGGLVGYLTNNASIKRSYATGAVSGNRSGGLVGIAVSGGSTSYSFWDTQTSGQSTSDGGTGKTTAEMQSKSTFTSAGWDFSHNWSINERSSYPYYLNVNDDLSALTLSSGTLDPTFDAYTTTYTTTVSTNVSSITLTPTLVDGNASITVNGTAVTSGQASDPISLNYGSNTINVIVTAEDGLATKNYTVDVTRKVPLTANGTQQSSGATGTNVAIFGSGFDPNASDHTITFVPIGGGSGTTATPIGLSGNILTTSVPAGLAAGPYRIQVQRASDGATATTTDLYNVVDRGGDSFTRISAGLPDLYKGSADWGDFDGDGDLDLVITGRDGSTPQSLIYKNNGNGTFSDISAGLTGLYYSSSEWGDFDGDGDLDLVITGYDASANAQSLIYENTGNGSFSDISAGITGSYEGSADWGDFDSDGDLDLVITGDHSGNLQSLIYENNGNGSFSDIRAGLTGLRFGSADWGDFNGDGDLDLVITGRDGSTPQSLIYKNNGDGTFSNISAGLTGLLHGSADWGDFNGDGDLDLVITGYDGNNPQSLIYENNGNSSFSDISAGLTGLYFSSSEWGDFDGDGDLELILTGNVSSSNYQSLVYRNNGNGSFSDIGAGLTGLSRGSADWGDFDSDGDLDLALTGYGGSDIQSLVYKNNNAPTVENVAFSGSMDIGQQLTGSYDYSDGDEDAESGSSYQWYRADDAGGANETAIAGANAQTYTLTSDDARKYIRFEVTPNDGNVAGPAKQSPFKQVQPGALQLTGTQQSSGAVGTRVDILGTGFDPNASDHTITFVPTDGGTGTTATPTGLTGDILTTTVPSSLAAGPYRIKVQRAYDGTDATTTELFSIVDRGGDGLIETSAGLADVYESSADWGDFDGDGDLDIAITGNNGSGPQSLIYKNNGDGTFSDISAGLIGLYNGSAKWGDIDGDGDLDLLITGNDGNNPQSLIYENDGGSFSDIGAGLTGLFVGSADWGDFDGDGDLDLLMTGNNGGGPQSLIYENNGSNFSTIGAGLTGLQHGSADWGDFDGDGDLDLLITGSDGSGPQSFIYENDGGSFSKLGAGLTGIGIGDGEWGDFDGDGDLDLVLTGDNSSGSLQSLIYENNGNDTFSTISASLTGVYNSSVNWGDLDGDGDLDLLITGYDGNNSQSFIYENDKNNNFSNISAGLTGVINGATNWGDFNGDGDLDILIVGRDTYGDPRSLIYVNNNTPTVANISISGSTEIGQQLTGSYDFSDRDGDTESGSTYQWYRADDASGTNQTAIAGANAQTYTLTSDDADKYIQFEVAPSDGNGTGTAGQSTFQFAASPFAGGTGTKADPYQVATADQLNEVRNFLDKYFIQTADINVSGYTNWDPIGWDAGSDGANSTAFGGQYNGNGHIVTNLTIEKTSSNQTQHIGLFAKISGTLKDLTIQNADITGQQFVGILSGQNSGTIQTVSVAGNIEGLANTGGLVGSSTGTIKSASATSIITQGAGGSDNAGGLVGRLGNGATSGTITKSYAEGSVTDWKNNAGGLVGQVQDGTITQSYATATISGAYNIGGLVGQNKGNISQAYAIGDVTVSQQYVGGLIGTNTGSGSVDKSFSVGHIGYNSSNKTYVGGFIGRNKASQSDITNSFWDNETSNYPSSAGGIGKTTHEMKDKVTFTATGWDFNSTWQIIEPSTGSISYPFLQSPTQTPPPGKYTLAQNADLSALSLSDGNLSPDFSANTTNYSTTVPANVTSVTVTPTLANAQATVTVNGTSVASGQASDPISLNYGSNTISMLVTAEDGSTKTYEIIVELASLAQVTLSNPATKATDISLQPNLKWENITEATYYELQLATDSSFKSNQLAISNSSVQDTVFQVQSELQRTTHYYWRVRAGTSSGYGKWSEVYEFSTIPHAPSKPTVQSPQNGETGIPLTPQLQWETIYNATAYQIEIAKEGDFNAPISKAETATPSFKLKTALQHVTSYSWRVRAVNTGGSSQWAGPHTFITKSVSPTLAFPTDQEREISIAPTLSWVSNYDGGKYRLQLATDNQMQNLVVDTLTTDQNLSISGLQSQLSYYWRVRTESPSTSDWSTPYQFETRGIDKLQLSTQITFGNGRNEINTFDYRLVSIPVAKSIPVENLFDGQYGTDWKVYKDNGTQQDFLQEHTKDNPLSFQAANGFWVLSRKPLKINEQQSAVPVSENDTYAITLNPGWNIISTPFDRSIKWDQIRRFNNLNANLYGYEGSYSTSMTMDPFKAYYIYNNKNTDVDLAIPYTNLDKRESPSKKKSTKKTKSQKVDITIASKKQQTDALISIAYVNNSTQQEKAKRYYPPLQLSKFGAAFVNNNDDGKDRKKLLQTVGDVYSKEKNHYKVEVKSAAQDLLTWKVQINGLEKSAGVLIVDSKEGRTKILSHNQENDFITGKGNKTFDVYTGSINALKGIAKSLTPQQITLKQNYPNPFNPQTTIRFGLDKKADVQLAVYDILGRKVHTLIDETRSAGWYKIPFDGSRLASGTYFYRIVIGKKVKTKKMMLIK